MNFPSRKLFFFFIPVVLVLGLFVLFKDKIMPKTPPTQSQTEVVAVKNSVINETDSDSDGLKDWEEVLWGTDPMKKISNPEKIPDADYIQKKIDAKEGLPTQNTNSLTAKALATPGEDATVALSKDIFAEYVSLKKSGNLNPASIDQLTERIASGITLPAEKQFTASGLKSFDDADLIKMRTYGNTFAVIQKKYQDLYVQSPLQAEDLTGGLAGNNPLSSQKLNQASKWYGDMATELMTLSVPKGLVSTHIDLANNYLQNARGLKNIAFLQSDPTRAVIGIEEYTNASTAGQNLIAKIISYLLGNGIIFISDEPGFSLNTLQ